MRVPSHSDKPLITRLTFAALLSCILTSVPFSYAAANTIDPSKLIKVTPENNPKCVEFFTYKSEMYCSNTPLLREKIDPHIKDFETQNIAFDDRPWAFAWGKKADYMTSVEYVPNGDDINNWHELVTSEFIPDAQDRVTPRQFSDFTVEQLKKSGFTPIITYHKDTPNQVILEYRIKSPGNLALDELQIITKGKRGMYIVHYVIKEADMQKANRDKWIDLLQKSTIK